VRFVLVFLVAGLACHSRSQPIAVADAALLEIPEAEAPFAETKLPPLSADGGWMQFANETYIAIPLGAREPRPIVVGLHGAQDRPDWSCAEWFGALAGFPFVVCPRGVPLGEGYAWTSVDAIASAAERAINLVRDRYKDWVAAGGALYGGWSQAAMLGPLVLAKRPDLFDAAVLVELGYSPMDPAATAASVRASKIKGLGIVCATARCETWAFSAKKELAKAVRTTTLTAGHRGHTFDGEVAKQTYDAVRFVEEGDARYEGLFSR